MQQTLNFRSFAITLAALGVSACGGSTPDAASAVEAKEVPAPSDDSAETEAPAASDEGAVTAADETTQTEVSDDAEADEDAEEEVGEVESTAEDAKAIAAPESSSAPPPAPPKTKKVVKKKPGQAGCGAGTCA